MQQWLDRREGHAVTELEKPQNDAAYHITFDTNPNNRKDIDRRMVLEYMKGKAEVYVSDIKEHSGAERLRVDALLSEGELEGYVKVITWSTTGAPKIVALAEDVVF